MKDVLMDLLDLLSHVALAFVYFAIKLAGVLLVFAIIGSCGVGICSLIDWILDLCSVSHEVSVCITKIVLTITSTVATCYYLVSNEFSDDDYHAPDLCFAVWITSLVLIWTIL